MVIWHQIFNTSHNSLEEIRMNRILKYILNPVRARATGLHKHDLFVDNGKLMHSERDSEAIDLTEGLPIVLYSYHKSHLGNDNVFFSNI